MKHRDIAKPQDVIRSLDTAASANVNAKSLAIEQSVEQVVATNKERVFNAVLDYMKQASKNVSNVV